MFNLEQNTTDAKLPEGVVGFVRTVNPDEKIFMLVERNVMSKDYSGARRFQLMYVRRNGELVAFCRDLGEVSEDIGEFVFPAIWEYSVAEAADVANQWREENGLKEKLDERAEKSTLMKDFHTLQEIKQAAMKGRRTYGPK